MQSVWRYTKDDSKNNVKLASEVYQTKFWKQNKTNYGWIFMVKVLMNLSMTSFITPVLRHFVTAQL